MGKVCTKDTVYLLLAVFLLGLPTLVRAVDVTFYSSTSSCSGSGYTVGGAGAAICYSGNAGAIRIQYATSCDLCAVYRDGGCTTNVYQNYGSICVVGGRFTGFAYNVRCRRRSLLADNDIEIQSHPDQLKITSVVFSEDSSNGEWVLKSSNADLAELYSQLTNVPDAEKLDWLKSHNAIYVEERSSAPLQLATIP